MQKANWILVIFGLLIVIHQLWLKLDCLHDGLLLGSIIMFLYHVSVLLYSLWD